MRPGKRAQLSASDPWSQIERSKASVRAKVEHCFHRIKRQFGYNKVRYRGLPKNTNRLYLLAGFTNLLRAQPYLAT
jgi:IS5 family transposase